jgi:hypothetical protein
MWWKEEEMRRERRSRQKEAALRWFTDNFYEWKETGK